MGYWVAIVDDDAIELKNARNLLSSDEMKVSCLRSGADLIRFMENNSPDLVLLDVLMPEMDGFETFHALREFEEKNKRTTTPVFFLTGDNDKDTERRGLKDGASDFIRKPIDKDILISRIIKTVEYNKTLEQLRQTASYDKLTGFLNKVSGTDRIKDMCLKSSGVLMIFDLDNFKLVNDIYGHDMGDQVLSAFADIVKRTIRAEDVICRIGGDEFLGYFRDLTSKPAIKALADRLNAMLINACIELMGDEFDLPIGISIGAVFVPDYSRDYNTLFKCADSAMYMVKQNGKHGVQIYEENTFEAGGQATDIKTDMARINKVLEERSDADGAMIIGKDAFIQNYRFAMRFLRRYKKGAAKVLFLITSENPEENISELTSKFINVLQCKLRKSDVIVQIKSDQAMVFLPLITEDEMITVANRITKDTLKELSGTVKVEYLTDYISFE